LRLKAAVEIANISHAFFGRRSAASLPSERLRGARLRNLVPAVLAGPALIVIPEIEHGLTEMLDDVGTIEIDVFHEGATFVAIEYDVFVFAGWPTAFDDDAQRVGRPHRGVRHVRRNEERLALANKIIDDPITFADADFNIAFQLVEVFFRIDQMKVVSSIRPFNNHHKKIATIIKVLIADRGLEEVAIRFDPLV
jgi:hypothetical protein